MAFTSADAYDRFMGRYSAHLAPQMADLAGVGPGQRALDVGCGPGALTAELVDRLGAGSVAAADRLPWPDASFDVTLAQLVVHFFKDPVAGLVEMRRVTRPGGVIAACVWDHGGSQGPLRKFWEAAREIDPHVDDESNMPGVRHGQLGEYFRQAGLEQVVETSLALAAQHLTFDEWWEPFTLGVGPAGSFVATLDPTQRARLRELCRKMLPEVPFVVRGKAWAARGVV